MTGKNHVRLVLGYPFEKRGVAEISAAGPACRRFVGRRMMHPEPAPGAFQGVGCQLRTYLLSCQRAIPPWADGEERVIEDDRLPIRGYATKTYVGEPLGDFFTR